MATAWVLGTAWARDAARATSVSGDAEACAGPCRPVVAHTVPCTQEPSAVSGALHRAVGGGPGGLAHALPRNCDATRTPFGAVEAPIRVGACGARDTPPVPGARRRDADAGARRVARAVAAARVPGRVPGTLGGASGTSVAGAAPTLGLRGAFPVPRAGPAIHFRTRHTARASDRQDRAPSGVAVARAGAGVAAPVAAADGAAAPLARDCARDPRPTLVAQALPRAKGTVQARAVGAACTLPCALDVVPPGGAGGGHTCGRGHTAVRGTIPPMTSAGAGAEAPAMAAAHSPRCIDAASDGAARPGPALGACRTNRTAPRRVALADRSSDGSVQAAPPVPIARQSLGPHGAGDLTARPGVPRLAMAFCLALPRQALPPRVPTAGQPPLHGAVQGAVCTNPARRARGAPDTGPVATHSVFKAAAHALLWGGPGNALSVAGARGGAQPLRALHVARRPRVRGPAHAPPGPVPAVVARATTVADGAVRAGVAHGTALRTPRAVVQGVALSAGGPRPDPCVRVLVAAALSTAARAIVARTVPAAHGAAAGTRAWACAVWTKVSTLAGAAIRARPVPRFAVAEPSKRDHKALRLRPQGAHLNRNGQPLPGPGQARALGICRVEDGHCRALEGAHEDNKSGGAAADLKLPADAEAGPGVRARGESCGGDLLAAVGPLLTGHEGGQDRVATGHHRVGQGAREVVGGGDREGVPSRARAGAGEPDTLTDELRVRGTGGMAHHGAPHSGSPIGQWRKGDDGSKGTKVTAADGEGRRRQRTVQRARGDVDAAAGDGRDLHRRHHRGGGVVRRVAGVSRRKRSARGRRPVGAHLAVPEGQAAVPLRNGHVPGHVCGRGAEVQHDGRGVRGDRQARPRRGVQEQQRHHRRDQRPRRGRHHRHHIHGPRRRVDGGRQEVLGDRHGHVLRGERDLRQRPGAGQPLRCRLPAPVTRRDGKGLERAEAAGSEGCPQYREGRGNAGPGAGVGAGPGGVGAGPREELQRGEGVPQHRSCVIAREQRRRDVQQELRDFPGGRGRESRRPWRRRKSQRYEGGFMQHGRRP